MGIYVLGKPNSLKLLTKVAEFADQSRRICLPKSPSLLTKVAEFADKNNKKQTTK